MALLAFVVLAALLLEDDDLRVAPEIHDGRADASAFNQRRANLRLIRARDHQNVQLDTFADLLIKQGNAHLSALFDAKLLAATPDYCVCHFPYYPPQVKLSPVIEKSLIIKVLKPSVNE